MVGAAVFPEDTRAGGASEAGLGEGIAAVRGGLCFTGSVSALTN